MNRLMRVVAALGLVLSAPALAADLDVIRAPRIVPPLPVIVPEPVVEGPVPFIVAVPAPPPIILHVPVPDSFFPFFEAPPPPLPSPTIFSAPIAYPIPRVHHAKATSVDEAEAMHYGYGERPQPELPLGYYGPNSLD